MRRFHILAVAAAVALLSAAAMAQAVQYEIDPVHSSAQFSVRHMMVSNVRGEFAKVTGTVVYDPKNLKASSVEATIDATTINTHEPRRDDDLKSPNFFDVAKYPILTFKSKKVEQAGAGKLRVTGDLTLHGVTKEVVLDVEGPSPEAKMGPNIKSGASAATTINRKDFGLVWNKTMETGGVLVGDEVKITLEIEMGRKAAAKPAGGAAVRPSTGGAAKSAR
ncbi:MAG TPA: YceI family protein [Terriglobales bacterium]|nr:YceI family protein [Terriglobales bacterium]